MNLKPVNSINNNANTIRVSDGNSPIRLIFKDVKGEVINLYDKIDYFYLTKDDEKFYSVTDISYDGDEVIIRLPKLRKGKYKAEIRDKDGSIYPANEDLYILLRRSFEDDKDIYYFGHREDILNSVEPMVIQHIDKNPDKFKGERGQQGFPGRNGLPGIDGKDGKDGKDGEKGDKGTDVDMSVINKLENKVDIVGSFSVNLKEYEHLKVAVSEGYDWSQSLKQIIEDSNGDVRVQIPPGEFIISTTIKSENNLTLVGSGVNITKLKSKTTNNKPMFDVSRNTTTSGFQTLFVEGITFIDEDSNTTGGYAFEVSDILNVTFEKCFFRGLGGGAIRATSLSNMTTDKVYVFNCGRNPYFNSPENGAIHQDRSGGYGNTLNILNTYISNCTNLSGVVAAGHSLRILNTTIESCHTLLKVGHNDYVSRNISVFGLYLENPKVIGIDIKNVRSGVFLNTYVNDSGSNATTSLKIHTSTDIKFLNSNLGYKGYDFNNFNSNIVFENYEGETLPRGISGINDSSYMTDVNTAFGDFGSSHNLIRGSNNLNDGWNGSAIAVQKNNFIDNQKSWELTKTNASDDKYSSITRDFKVGDKVVFSFYLKGTSTYRMRGRKSDGTYVDIVQRSGIADEWQRVYISSIITENYDLIHVRLSPGTSANSAASCEVAFLQFEHGKIEPGPFVLTEGSPITNEIHGSTNGDHYSSGKLRASEGLGVGNTSAASSLGDLQRKMEIFDIEGNSIGFVPIYNNIT